MSMVNLQHGAICFVTMIASTLAREESVGHELRRAVIATDVKLEINTLILKSGLKSKCLSQFLSLNQSMKILNNDSIASNLSVVQEVVSWWQPWLSRSFPDCWHSLETLICDQYLSKSGDCQQLCSRARQKCRMLKFLVRRKLSLLDCSSLPEKTCSGNFSDLFDLPTCGRPFVSTNLPSNWVITWEDDGHQRGCGLQCQNKVLLDEKLSRQVSVLIGVLGGIALLLCLLNVFTFLIAWKQQNRYPAVILFFLNACLVCCFAGWLLQYVSDDVKTAIICRSDGTKRVNEPSDSGNGWCLLSFVLIYFGSTSTACWFALLAYGWNVSFKSLGTMRDHVSGKVKYFHIIAWTSSLLLMLGVLFAAEVHADPFTGICFLSYASPVSKTLLLNLPVMIAMLAGEICLISSILTLRRYLSEMRMISSVKTTKNIVCTIRRLVLFAATAFTCTVCPVGTDFYRMRAKQSYAEEFLYDIGCVIVQSSGSDRPSSDKPCNRPGFADAVLVTMDFFCLFAAAMVTCSWTWTKASLRVWLQAWKRLRKVDRQRSYPSWHKRMLNKRIRPLVPSAPAEMLCPGLAAGRKSKSLNDVSALSEGVGQRHLITLPALRKGSWNLSSSQCDVLQKEAVLGCDRLHEDQLVSASVFSGRRGTILSMHSVNSLDVPREGPVLEQRVSSQALHLLGTVGHLVGGSQVFQSVSRRSTSGNISLGYLEGLRSRLQDHFEGGRDTIVAGCMPSTPVVSPFAADLSAGISMSVASAVSPLPPQ